MRIRAFIPLLSATLLLSACGKDDPAPTQTPTVKDTTGTNDNGGNNDAQYTGTNGLVINGDGMSNVSIDADSVGVRHGGSGGVTSTVMELYFTLNGKKCLVKVNRYGNRLLGSFTWGGMSFEGGNCGLTIYATPTIEYAALSGTTTITNLGAVGETIDGSFKGTLALDGDATRKVNVNGKFSGIRTY